MDCSEGCPTAAVLFGVPGCVFWPRSASLTGFA